MNYSRLTAFDGLLEPAHIIWAAVWAAIFHIAGHLLWSRRAKIVINIRKYYNSVLVTWLIYYMILSFKLRPNKRPTGGALFGLVLAIVLVMIKNSKIERSATPLA